jgi:hypothetical protein
MTGAQFHVFLILRRFVPFLGSPDRRELEDDCALRIPNAFQDVHVVMGDQHLSIVLANDGKDALDILLIDVSAFDQDLSDEIAGHDVLPPSL